MIRVVYVTADLGPGGTAKGVISFATGLDRSRFAPEIITTIAGGAREDDLRSAGISTSIACSDQASLSAALTGADIVHVFRHGLRDPLVPDAVKQAGVPVLIESNIFGAYDTSADERLFACHLFGSMMCLLRYQTALGSSGPDARHRVLYFPPESERLHRSAPPQADARRALGLDPDRPVVTRFGRAADLKWRNLIVDMIPRLLSLVPDVQVVLNGVTPTKRERLAKRGVLDRVHLVEPGAGDEKMALLYAATDVGMNASMIGESQGLVINEAMAMGVPVVTCSTPWVDNAQVEFVESGRTGWVANHPTEFAEALADLVLNPERRAEFGENARLAMEAHLDTGALVHQLEGLYEHHLCGTPVAWSPGVAEVQQFALEYPGRSSISFRKLSLRERSEAWLERSLEMITRKRASVQMLLRQARRRISSS